MINWIKNLFKKKENPIVPIYLNNWSVSRTTGRIVFKIPVGNLSKEDAQKTIKELMSRYNTTMPISTNYWFPSPGMTKSEKIEKILNKIKPKEEF
jgi:hypothetical protein